MLILVLYDPSVIFTDSGYLLDSNEQERTSFVALFHGLLPSLSLFHQFSIVTQIDRWTAIAIVVTTDVFDIPATSVCECFS